MTEQMRMAKKKTVIAASGLMMLCSSSLMLVVPALHRMHVAGVYVIVTVVLLESFGVVMVVRSLAQLVRLKRRENEG